MNPMIDTARLFAKHGVDVTIITTQANALLFKKPIDNDLFSGYSIKACVIQFPAAQVGLPDGVENIKDATSREMLGKIMLGIAKIQDQIEILFHDLQQDCIVSDMLFPWTVQSAAKRGIPRLYYYSSSYFSSCAAQATSQNLVSDSQKFSIPGLPHNIEITSLQLQEYVREWSEFSDYFDAVYESEGKSYGTLCNSFHELEGDYENLYKSTMGIKAWSVGPVSAWLKKEQNEDVIVESELLNWLNSKPNDSVLYVSFGSLTRLSHSQIVEIAHGLENSGHNFIWVVRKKDGEGDEDGFLDDFKQRMKENKKGYIIWNWAPQLLILGHPATAGVVTHCGWNSILESLSVSLPIITWPMFAEQFYNEKLLVFVLKIVVSVGSKVNTFWSNEGEVAVI
ncbi:putative soyasapogenol B glucuronide galactosyltransferase [Medicago truncatula]|uniref:Putative soyasapogenol B glucuronide galactosyltransferase n=1 Tax=Medicago truncatula TaxID=3880 RepID=A0A396GZN9_MEDTR|nr:putative soyasapogenol B glucuronide galactosyltransferase [Medicago truncatula]